MKESKRFLRVRNHLNLNYNSILIVIFFLFIVRIDIAAQENPFFSTEKQPAEIPSKIEQESPEGPAPGKAHSDQSTAEHRNSMPSISINMGGRIFPKLASLQRNLHETISQAIYSVREKRSFGVIISILGVSFLYGFIHALGPGHRKLILTSYFLSEAIQPAFGILMAFFVAMLHGLTALVLISILFFLLNSAISISFNSTYLLIEKISYAIIAILGIYLVFHVIREWREEKGNKKRRIPGIGKKKVIGRIIFVISNGIIPCPGAAMLLVFTFAFGLYAVGILAIIAMSIGMGLLLSTVAAVVLLGKDKGLKRLLNQGRGKTIFRSIELAGGMAVFISGGLLFLGSF